jgi:FkbM family methyltransferase
MKNRLKRLLRKYNLYYALRYSLLFRAYQRLFKPGTILSERKEVRFYESFLSACDLVFDIGAYDGHKTEALLHLSKKVVAIEPDPLSFSILTTRFRNKRKRVFLENKAIADAEDERKYYIHHPGSAFNTLNPEWKEKLQDDNLDKWDEKINFTNEMIARTTTLDLLIKKYGVPYFIKIDVEGYEKQVLDGLSEPVPFLSFEGLWPDWKTEIECCVERIQTIYKGALYNVAEHETLLLPEFTDRGSLFDWLNKSSITHLEIVVKMI